MVKDRLTSIDLQDVRIEQKLLNDRGRRHVGYNSVAALRVSVPTSASK